MPNDRKKCNLTSSELIEEVIEAIRVDRENINMHIVELSNIVSNDQNKYREVGTTLVKFMEDAQKANDQFIKAVAALQRNEEYDMDNEPLDEEEPETYESLLEKMQREKEDGKKDTD